MTHSGPTAEVGHCVHHIAMHRSRPDVLFMQKHWDVMRSNDAGESWQEVSGNLPTDFGLPSMFTRMNLIPSTWCRSRVIGTFSARGQAEGLP